MAQTRSILIKLSHINYLLHTFSSEEQNFIFPVKIFFSYLSYMMMNEQKTWTKLKVLNVVEISRFSLQNFSPKVTRTLNFKLHNYLSIIAQNVVDKGKKIKVVFTFQLLGSLSSCACASTCQAKKVFPLILFFYFPVICHLWVRPKISGICEEFEGSRI